MFVSGANRVLISLLLLTAAIVLTFGQGLRNDFINFDDQKEIVENPDFNPVTLNKLNWNWTHTRLTLYMPVTYFVWGAVAAIAPRDSLGVLQPAAFHALSLGLHILCSMLVFLLILQLLGRVAPALVGGLIFALHPIQTETVAWASGMYTLLSTAFSLAALIAYTAYVTNVQGRAKFFFLLATLLYLLALLTKAASVSLPIAAGVIDLFLLGRPLRLVSKSLFIWVAFAIPIVLMAKHFQDVSMLPTPPLWARPVVALDAVGFYVRCVLAPIHLIPDYGRNPTWVSHHPWAAMLSIGVALLAILAAVFARRSASWLTAGISLLIAGIAPYLGLTTFDFQYVSTVADRYAYFGMTGVALLIAGAVLRSRAAGVCSMIAVVLCGGLSYRQIQRWHDTDTLFSYTLNINPRSLISHNIFGYLAAKNHQSSLAESHYLAALDIWPQDAVIQFNLGNLYRVDHPNWAIQRYIAAVQYQPRNVQYRNNLAAALARNGQPDQAYQQWEQVIAQDSTYIDARNNLGDLLANAGRRDEARLQYRAALQIDPHNSHALEQLSQLHDK